MPTFRSSGLTTIERMQQLADDWAGTGDGRSTFLACYRLMTSSMISAVEHGEFADPEWVDRLLGRFAEHYFAALIAYDEEPALAPAAWRRAHDSCRDPEVWTIQRLLLGINAHINVDLALTLDELLRSEWHELPPPLRAQREADFHLVNEIISRSADIVQDEVLEAAVPSLGMLDVLLGRGDEFMASRLLFTWRDHAWQNTLRLVEAVDQEERQIVLAELEEHALRMADGILLTGGPQAIAAVFYFGER